MRGGSKPPHSPIVVRKFASETGEGGEGPPGSAGGGLGGVEPGEGLGLGLGQQGPLQGPEDDLLSILSGSEAAPSIASGIGGRGRRRPGPAGPGSIPRLKEGPQTAKFQAVLANLPVIDTSKLPPKWSPTKVGWGGSLWLVQAMGGGWGRRWACDDPSVVGSRSEEEAHDTMDWLHHRRLLP